MRDGERVAEHGPEWAGAREVREVGLFHTMIRCNTGKRYLYMTCCGFGLRSCGTRLSFLARLSRVMCIFVFFFRTSGNLGASLLELVDWGASLFHLMYSLS